MIVQDAHQSGRFDASDDERAAMLTALAQVATVGVLTEAVGVLPIEGWLSAGAETKVFFDTSAWVLEEHGKTSLPTPPWHRGSSLRTTVDLTWALLSDVDTGLTLLRVGGHLPAHLFKKPQAVANQAALTALGPALKALRTEHRPDVTTASFDFNRPLSSGKQRGIIREAVRGNHLKLVVPPKATRGLRKIDGFLTSGDLPEPSMLPKAKGFDHTGVSLLVAGCPR